MKDCARRNMRIYSHRSFDFIQDRRGVFDALMGLVNTILSDLEGVACLGENFGMKLKNGRRAAFSSCGAGTRAGPRFGAPGMCPLADPGPKPKPIHRRFSHGTVTSFYKTS